MKFLDLPFPIGDTFWGNGNTVGNATDGANLEGKTYEGVEDIDLSSTASVKPHRTAKYRKLMVVRNVSAGVLLPGFLVTFKVSGLLLLGQVDGYADTSGELFARPVDEFLPAAGVAVNDLFYVVLEGPAMCKTPLSADASNVLPVGTVVAAMTAVTSGATTAGRVAPQDLTGATAVLIAQVQGALGRVLSAKTTANTNSSILIDLSPVFG